MSTFETCLAETLKWEGGCLAGRGRCLYIPETLEPLGERCPRHSGRPSDVAEGQSLPAPVEQPHNLSINGLLFSRRPAAVFSRVADGAVNSVQGFAIWAFAHVLKEVFKAVQPSSAHRDAAGSVPGIRRIVGLVATIFGGLPRTISWAWLIRAVSRWRVTMLFAVLTNKFAMGAAAASDVSSLEIMASDRFSAPAIALAHPVDAAPMRGRWFRIIAANDSHQSVSVPSTIDQLSHFGSSPR